MSIDFESAVLLFMMRVTCAFDFDHLAYLFGVKTSKTARVTFQRMLLSLNAMFEHSYFNLMWESKLTNAPAMKCMEDFPSCLLTLDCTEFFIQTPRRSALGKLTWSSYKHHHTVKVLVGLNRAGEVAFVSPCYPGRASDKQIITFTKILEQLPPGCSIMVDKGFLIADLASKYGINIVMPPMVSSTQQLSKEKLASGRKIATTRIHVERGIERVKRFRLLGGEISNSALPYISKVVRVCFFLTNLQGSLVLDVESGSESESDE